MLLLQNPAPDDVFFRGRKGDVRLGEWVIPTDKITARQKIKQAVVFGYPDDQGVTKNRGRSGAAKGPDSIRKELYKLTIPADLIWEKKLSLLDLGNIAVSSEIDQTHSRAQALAEHVAANDAIGIALGGGHDFAAPTFRGFHSTSPKSRWGLINIDPHLDTREMEGPFAHSGNAFRVLLENGVLQGKDLVQFGARANRNTRSSWEYCVKKKVNIVSLESMREHPKNPTAIFQKQLAKLSQSCKQLGVTIDMDCCFETEGSSAAPVLGFSAWELCSIAACAGRNPKVKYLEIAEVAPPLENSSRAARIAAEVIFSFLRAKSEGR